MSPLTYCIDKDEETVQIMLILAEQILRSFKQWEKLM